MFHSLFGFQSQTRKHARRTRNAPDAGLTWEHLEERKLLSTIIWANRWDFDTEFGPNTATARAVIDQAVVDWQNAISSFNYAVPQNYQFNLYVADIGDPTVLANGSVASVSIPDLKPTRGSIVMDDNAAGGGWYFDPAPADDVEFTIPIAPFAALGPTSGVPAGTDFYSVVVHELGHALGMSRNSSRWVAAAQNGLILLPDNSYAFLDPDKVHIDAFYHPFDAMNPGIGPGMRKVISTLDLKVLAKVFDYGVNLPFAQQRSFVATLDPATRQLTVMGDLTSSYDDIRVDVFPGGQIIVNVNGLVKNFSQTAVGSIAVFGRSGSDDIRIGATAANQPLYINGGDGFNKVYLSYSAFDLGTIRGDIAVIEENGLTTVNFEDGRRTAPRTFSFDAGFVTFSGSNAKILYSHADPAFNPYELIIRGGSGGNSYTINNQLSNAIIRLFSGLGNDTVNVLATKGPVFVEGVAGWDRVTIGRPDGFHLGLILGSVFVSNAATFTDLIVDGTAGHLFSPREIFVRNTSLQGLASASIFYEPAGIKSLTIKAPDNSSPTGNTFQVLGTPENRANNLLVNLQTGRFADTVNVRTTASVLSITGKRGADKINLGFNGSVRNIAKAVYVVNPGGASAVNVDNSADNVSRTTIVYKNGPHSVISGLTPGGDIVLRSADLGSLLIRTGAGGNNFRIHDTPAVVTTSIFTGSGNDRVEVDGTRGPLSLNVQGGGNNIFIGTPNETFETIQGPISLRGPGGGNTVRIDNQRSSASQVLTHTVTATSYKRTGVALVTLNDIAQFALWCGAAADTIDVQGRMTPNTGLVSGFSIFAGAGHDVMSLGSVANQLSGFGTMSLTGEGGVDTLNIHDHGSAAAKSYAIDNVLGIQPYFVSDDATFLYSGLENTRLRGGSGGNMVRVKGTAAGSSHLVESGSGSDSVIVGTDAGSLANLHGQLSLDGQDGLDQATFNDQARAAAENYSFYPGAISTTFAAPDFLYSAIEALSVNGSAGVNNFGFSYDPGPSDPAISLNGGGSNNLLAGPHVPNLWRITGQNAGSLNSGISFASMQSLSGGQADDTFVVIGEAGVDGSINGLGGVNTLDYSEYAVGSGSGIPGLVSWYQAEGDFNDAVGGNHGTQTGGVAFDPGQIGQAFSFDDNYIGVPNAANLEPAKVSVEAWVNSWIDDQHNRYILAKGADGITGASYALYTGPSGGLSFYVYDGELNYAVSPVADAGIWDDTWHHVVGTYDGASVRLYVDGVEVGEGTPTDMAIGYGLSDSNDLWLGAYPGPELLSFVGRVDEPSIFSRALSPVEVEDLFVNGKSLPADDGVDVNLQLGTSSGLAGGIANIQNVIGSVGNDVLVGNGGNVLDGGAGRDLLIAGAFASVLTGGADDDILIAGTTDYDGNQAALRGIMAEWTSTRDYATRVGNLTSGLGVPLLDATTVHSNGGGNTVQGAGGLDFFFARLGGVDTLDADPFIEELVAI
jgi:Concanavalin A-like lectin/glucanases superfamily